ncbi:ABC transporter substrate-binding protein [Bartonella apihabitans]|uniref:ABC transporter substrate-binding protein n=1 Tax=uncultured Bartonella sp. TaxID=104108 RepID=UPI0025FD28AD|nr:ABC transporter substrate-binding protein [Bartonella apihabitans]WLT08269.1 ABC transporter substrate-binding protein [Bartonella apihabitans]
MPRLTSRLIFFVVIVVLVVLARNATINHYAAPKRTGTAETFNIYGTTDALLFQEFIKEFKKLHPDIPVRYKELESGEIFRGVIQDSLTPPPDLIISSAVDLQIKLANDGYAADYFSPYLQQLPDWAQWHNEVIGFTFEPAVIAYNRKLIGSIDVPTTHLGLAKLIEENKQQLYGKIGTYNIATSGVGYVLATQDEFISSNFWRLTNALASGKAKLSASSPEVLDSLEKGDIIIAYNLLGSYAFARALTNPDIVVVIPSDYALVIARSALIPRHSTEPEIAKEFIDFLLSPDGQKIAAGNTGFGAIMPGIEGQFSVSSIMKNTRGTVQPIAMTPALLVNYDGQKRGQFLRVWLDIINGNTTTGDTLNSHEIKSDGGKK